MFTLGMKEASSDEVPVGDVSCDAFLALLQYLYSGRVDISEETIVGKLYKKDLFISSKFFANLFFSSIGVFQSCLWLRISTPFK